MKMTAPWLSVVLMLAAGPAAAVPGTVTFTGRLSTSSGPVHGPVNMTFRLFDAAADGNQRWTETRPAVPANQGLVVVALGAVIPLDEVVFDGTPLFLEVEVDSEVLAPRLAVESMPYAIRAGFADNADTLGGTISPGDVVTSVSGTGAITAVTSGNSVALQLSSTGCASNAVWQFDGTNWNCVTLPGAATYTGQSPVTVTGTVVGLSTVGCSSGDVWKYNGTTWSCDPDIAGATYTGAAPISVSGGVIQLSNAGCSNGDVMKYSAGGWACGPDATGGAEVDGIIGNEVTSATNATLVRSGGGTAASPYTLGLNLGSINTWSAQQTFNGGVVGSTFRYTTPRTSYHYVAGASFHHDTDIGSGPWAATAATGNAALRSGQRNYLTAQLNLPDGATIQTMACYIMDNDTGSNMSGSLTIYRRTFGSASATTIGSVALTTAGASSAFQLFENPGLGHIVDKNVGGYYLYLWYNWTAPVSDVNSQAVGGCRIGYSMPGPE